MTRGSTSAFSAVALLFVLAASAYAWASLGSLVVRALHSWN
jgi:hypothetical protein